MERIDQELRPKSEKEIKWQEKLAEVEKITDRLGMGVDEGIKETVAILLLYGFTTCASCEGHLAEEGEKQHGLPCPWVDVYVPEAGEWETSQWEAGKFPWEEVEEDENIKQLKQKWKNENLRQQREILDLLDEFYQGRKTPFDIRLTLCPLGSYGFRIYNVGGETIFLLPPEEQKQKFNLYRKEMKDFTEFLKSRYFSED